MLDYPVHTIPSMPSLVERFRHRAKESRCNLSSALSTSNDQFGSLRITPQSVHGIIRATGVLFSDQSGASHSEQSGRTCFRKPVIIMDHCARGAAAVESAFENQFRALGLCFP